MNKLLFVDYENVQDIDLDLIKNESFNIRIFIGKSQSKVPVELVKRTQELGKAVQWIQVEGQGHNALDFFIALFLGRLTSENKKNNSAEYIILSKDKGFDPLLKYLTTEGHNCKRINSLLELKTATVNTETSEKLTKAIENLAKIEKSKRPRNQNTLSKHIKTLFGKKLDDKELKNIMDRLFIDGKLSEQNNRLTYNF